MGLHLFQLAENAVTQFLSLILAFQNMQISNARHLRPETDNPETHKTWGHLRPQTDYHQTFKTQRHLRPKTDNPQTLKTQRHLRPRDT